MRQPTIFISYNPDSDLEETLAVRLHAIGAVNGFNMFLPDRYNDPYWVSDETMNRIRFADYFILFSTTPLSKTVEEEINIAYEKLVDKSRIIVIHDINAGKKLDAPGITEIYIDTQRQSLEEITSIILNQLIGKHSNVQNAKNENAVGGLILAGIGLLLMGALVSNGKGR